MKIFITIFCCLATFYGCAQPFFSIKGNDLVVFTTKEKGIVADSALGGNTRGYNKHHKAVMEKPLLQMDTVLLLLKRWQIPSGKPSYYRFFKGGDTMIIKCECGQSRNYLFSNLAFRKGAYELRPIRTFQELEPALQKARKAKAFLKDKTLLATQFEDTYLPNAPSDKRFQTLPLREISFVPFDLTDTTHVLLRPLQEE